MTVTDKIENTEDVIDSRQVIERINDLESEEELDEDEAAELTALKSLAEEAEGYAADWQHGECLIRDSYFTDYARELLEDCGDLPRDLPHYISIDWEETASNIQADYTSVDFDGVTYWIR